MEMNKLYKTEDIVLKVLENQPETRKDDYLLILSVWESICPEIKDLSISFVFANIKELKLPSFKTIERNRRKIFETRKDLTDKKTTDARFEETITYIDYALNK